MARNTTKKSKLGIIGFFSDRKVQVIIGVILFFVAVYITLALVSFIHTGKNDESIIAEYGTKKTEYIDKKSHKPLSDADKTELKNIKKDLQVIQHKAENLMGYSGAKIAQNLINNWLGLGVFFLAAFLLFFALKLIGIKKISVWKSLLFFVFLAIWISLLLAFVLDPFIENSFIRFGGNFGLTFKDWLAANIGNLGTLLVIIGSGLVFAILTVSGTIPFFKNINML